MPKAWDVSRRKFLGVLGATTLIHDGEARIARAEVPEAPHPQEGWKALQAPQVATLEAIAEQIVPADQDPGAREAGAVRYIDDILSGNQAEKLTLYAAGLEGIDQTSQLLFGQDFVKLSWDRQAAVLSSLEQGAAQGEVWRSFSSQEFFAMVWGHVLESFYGPPEDGGNKGFASWKMMGFPEHSGTM